MLKVHIRLVSKSIPNIENVFIELAIEENTLVYSHMYPIDRNDKQKIFYYSNANTIS